MKAHSKVFDYPVFALGFRAFFALAGLSALALLVLWNAMFKGELSAAHYFPPAYWHGHEMLLGYATAVIAGFLLTAVKNWTGKPSVSGDPLAALCLLWLYGRILPFYAGLLPDALIALVDFAFLPALAIQVSKPILAAKQWQHLLFVAILGLLALGNGLIHGEMLELTSNTAACGFQLVIGTMVLLILIIAGRVIPFFTERGISGTLIISLPIIDNLAIATAALVFALQMGGATGYTLAFAAVAATLVNGFRLATWYVPRIWYVPLLWVLFVGYAWLIVGFVLTALVAFTVVLPSLAMHAFTLGGIGVLTLGMMARVALGHTGRAMKASNTIAIAFVLINLAAVVRVLLPMTWQESYKIFVYGAGLSWLAAFALFVFVYLPILTSPRIDQQEG